MNRRRLAPLAVFLLLLALLLPGLGWRHLWQDEIETAERARSILESGLPKVVDARGVVSVNAGGKELEEGLVHRYTPWLQFYWAAWGLGLGRELGLDADTAVRLPFAAAHAGAAALITAALPMAPLPAAVIGTSWGLGSIRLLHGRSCRYHSLIDLLVVLGLLALARRSRALLFVVIFLLPQAQTLAGALFSVLLAGCGAWLYRQEDRSRWRRRALVSLVLPGLLSLAVLLVLCRPWASSWGRLDGPNLKSLRDVGGSLVPLLFWLGSGFWLRRRGERDLSRTVFWCAGLSVALAALAESHTQSQPRYYLPFGILSFFWPLALGFGGLDEAARKRYWAAVFGTFWFLELFLWALPVFIKDPTRVHTHRPLQGVRVALRDWAESRKGTKQPLHEALALARAGQGAVLIDYAPQFVNWYLPGRSPALMPDPVYRDPRNRDNPAWDRPRDWPAWHLWYPSYGSGTWECKPDCDYRAESYADGRYTLISKSLNRSEKMCVVRSWATHQWNNAPFMELRPSASQPQGEENGALVLARPCP